MKNYPIKYEVVAALLVIFIVVSWVISQNTGNPADQSSQPQAVGTSSYVPKSEPVKVEMSSQPVPQQVVIQFAPGATDAERQEYIQSIGGTVVQSINSLDTVVVNVSEAVAQAPLPESKAVEASEADYYVSALDDLAPVNDPHYADQWALPAIGAPDAWASMPVDAPTVTIAVIDSGICVAHPDLVGHIVNGWDFIESDSVPQDDFGHGCSVSGVIAANINDGIGIAGIAPNARIMPLRVLNASGVGSYSDVAAAIVYAVDNGAQVINLSLGGSSPSSMLENAINYAASNGVIVVAAAGNNGTEGVLYPAAYDSVIAVGSIDPNLQHSTFSNYGSQVDVWAPGRDILTTKSNGDYGLVSGTSFAAPYVAGAEAVYMALSRTPIFAGGVLTFATQIDVTAEPTIVVQETPTETQVTNIDDAAVLEKLRLLYNVPSNYGASIQNIEQTGGTMFGLFIIPAPDGVDAGPAAHYFTAVQNGTEITVSKEYTPQFSEALDVLNAAGAVNQSLVTAFNSASAQGDGTAQLGLPWTSGVSATFVKGPHGDGFEPASTVLSALDFAPVNNKVAAAREGFAQKIICPEEMEASWVIVTHADGWRTSYYQVTNIQVDVNGRQVGRGEWLGDVAPDSGTALRCGGSSFTQAVHFAVLRDGKQVKIDGFDIGGWTVGGSGAGGTLTRVSDAAVVSVAGTVLNNGTFGTNLTCDATVLPPGYIKCSEEGGTCSFSGTEDVYFGAGTCFAIEPGVVDGITCNNTAFGVPAGEYKSCYVDSHSSTLNPACPQSGGVILYWNSGFTCTNGASDAGYRLRATSGTQNVNDGSFNDKASSLRVPPDWSVMLYGGADKTGEKVCYNTDVSDLATQGNFPGTAVAINDNVTSMEVFSNSGDCNGTILATPPQPLLPANGSSNAFNFDLIFQWAGAPGAVDYQVEWWNNSTPGTKLTACDWSVPAYCDVVTPAPGTYSWHVKGRNGDDESGWSPLWTFTIRPNADAIFLSDLFTTDDLGPSGIGTDNMTPLEDVASSAFKDTFNPGDPIRLYLIFTNEFNSDRIIDGEWQVLDPAGRVVSEMSDTSSSTSGNANDSYYWFRSFGIPTDSVRGEYTFVGKITGNGVTTTQSRTFTVTGSAAVEVYDAFATDSVGAASLDAPVPQPSVVSDVISKADPTFNAGDGIRLYIDTFNDVTAGASAVFNWEVMDPQGRHVPQLEWNGTLTSALNHTWWSLPATIPANAVTGDYRFTGSITYNSNVTSQTQTFHVTGPAVPANDSFSTPVVIGSVPYTVTQDTWNTTTASTDPYSVCGGQNSNSVWYRYTPASNGLLEIDTSGSTYDVEIGVWTGVVDNLNLIRCNEVRDPITNEVLIENLPVTSGTVYYIELTDLGTPGAGHLKLRVDFASSVALTNDDFDFPITITNNTTINNPGASTTQDVRAASTAGDDRGLDACNRLPGKASVWYKYTTTLPGELVLDTKGSDYDTMLSVWTGDRLNLDPVACNDDIGDVSGAWDTDSTLTVTLDATTTYYIEISEFDGAIENVNSASINGLGGKPVSDISAEFSGGQMHLNSKFNPAPILDSPADNAFTTSSTPTLSVFSLAGEGAASYQFQVSDTADFASPQVVDVPDITTPSPPLGTGIYYWRARAKDAGANFSAWSRARSLSVTTLISPANNSVTSSTKPTFTWGATSGALEYNMQVDESTSFATPEIDRFQTSGTSFTPTTVLVFGDHYWRLRVRTAGGWGNWTPAWKFTILQPLTAPVLAAPANASATKVTSPLFSWNSVPSGNTYRIEIDNDANFSSPVQTHTTSLGNPLSYTASPLADGTYSWRVRAINVLNESGPWSLVRTITIDTVASSAPILNLPVNNGFTSLSRPTLSVFASAGAAKYTFWLDTEPFTNPNKIPLVYKADVTTTSYTLIEAQVLPYGIYYWRARAKDAAGNNSLWSEIRTLTITPMTNPVNNGYATIATPTFTWAAATGALEYHLQISKTDTFAALEFERNQASGTSYVVPAMDYGAHYWRMQVRTASGWSVWAPTWKFTVTPALSAAPVLTSPASAALLTDNTPTLTWNKVMDDDRYEIWIDNTSTFASPEQTFVNATGVLNYTATTLPDGLYYWRVRTSNYLSVPGAWSTSRTFTIDTTPPAAPTLSLPADTATIVGTPVFSWLTTATATKYQLQYADDAGFSIAVYTSAEVTTLNHTPPAMPLGLHYWHVKAKDLAGNWGAWSTVRTVTITPPVPVAPVLTAPTAGLVTNYVTPVFIWNAVGSGTPYIYTYEFQLSTASTFTSILQSYTGLELTYTATTLPGGIYYWRVRAVNSASVAGPWATFRTFTVDLTPPLAPVLSSPLDGAANVGTPLFRWVAAATATKYQFEYDIDSGFSSTIPPRYSSLELTTTSHTPSPAMALGTYYWHVRAKDPAGNWGPWSATRTVIINPPTPVAPVLTAPVNALVTNNTTPVFTWNSVAGTGITYEFQIATTSTFASPVQTQSMGTSLTYTYNDTPPLTNNALHYWRVRALNSALVPGSWSTYRTITIDTTPPIAPTLSSPAAGAAVVGTPAFSWVATATATKYQFEYDDDSGFLSPNYTSGELTTTSHTPPTMVILTTYSWHVRAKDAAGNWGPWSVARLVTINPPIPVAPVLTAPVNALVTNNTTPVFTWNSVAGTGITYEFQIATTSTFASPIQTQSMGTSLTYTYNNTPPLSDSIHYWHVRALNAALVPGPWSAYRTFTLDTTPPLAPALSSPLDGASAIGTPAFSWATAATATKYQFEYDDDTGFAAPPLYTSLELTTTNHTPTPAMPLGTYYWHVRAKDLAGNWSSWSAYRTVTILPLVPAAPVLTAPTASLVTNDTTPVFTWNSVVSGNTYQIQISTVSTFASTVRDVTGAPGVLTYTASPALADGIYYWRVRAWNVIPTAGAWSASRSFTIDFTPPLVPSLTAPVDLASVVGTPAFTWASSATAAQYQFQYATNTGFTTGVYTPAAQATTSHTPSPALLAGTYYWHVKAKDAVGNWSAYSAYRTVTILPPAAPILSAPGDAAIMIGTPSFSWASSVTATKYQFQYDNDAGFPSPTYTSSDLTTLNHTPPVMATPGTYYWHVRARDTIGNWSNWSTARTVTVNPPTPVAPVLTAPANALVMNDSTPNFTWNAVAGTGITYEIQISTVSTFASTVQAPLAFAPTTYTASPALADGIYYWRVRALNNAIPPVPGAWSTSRSFTVDTNPPLAPALSAPLDGASNIGTPAFSWASAVTATKYQFQYATNTGFSVGVYTSLELTTTSHTPPAMPSPVTYYWHVSAKDPAGNWSPWSAYRTVTILPTVPLAPTLTAPVNALVTNNTTPVFTWNSVVSGNTYQIQISTVSTFVSTVQDVTGAPGVLTYTASPALADGIYYWRVRAWNVTPTAGTWSTSRTFTIDTTPPIAPTLSSPAAGGAVIGTPAFSWAATATATKYQFEYDDDSGFLSPNYTSGELTTTSHTPPTMATLTTYSWHVRAKDAAGNWGSWSAARLVTINPPIPVAPVLTAPVNALVTNNTIPVFTWNSVPNGVNYEIQISTVPTFTSTVQAPVANPALTYTATTLTDGIYYWHVRAVNAALVAGPWSAYRSFTIDTIAPLAPVLSSPADNASVTGTPAFMWLTTATATRYQFEYDNNADFSSPIYTSAEVTTLTHTPPTISLGIYYWHVKAKDAAGNWGPWSTSRTVNVTPVAATGTPTLLTPANSSIIPSPTPTLTWSAVTGAVSYRVQMDKNSTFSSPDIDVLTPVANLTVGSILADGTYYWRVRKVDTYGGVGPWSAVWRVNVIQVIPLAVTTSLSALSDSFDTATPTLSWNSVENGATYQIQVDNDKDFSTPSFDDTADTTTRTLPAPLSNGEYFWRVRAINIYETPGPWSETWPMRIDIPPVVPVLLLPADTSTSSTGAPAFSWQNVTNAKDYQIQVDNNENFNSPEFDDTAASTSRTVKTPLTNGEYFWRVRAMNIYDTPGEWSDSRTVTISIPPLAPLLVTPEDEATDTTGMPTFNWESVSNGDTYQIQVDDDEDFSTPLFDDVADTTTRELVTPLADGTYFWRVRAMNIYDVAGTWSDSRTVTISVPLVAPVLLTPEADAAETTGLPAFSWEAVINGDTYQIQVDDDEDFSTPLFDDVADTTTRELVTPLENGTYYWRVRAINIDGNPGEWSLIWIVTITMP